MGAWICSNPLLLGARRRIGIPLPHVHANDSTAMRVSSPSNPSPVTVVLRHVTMTSRGPKPTTATRIPRLLAGVRPSSLHRRSPEEKGKLTYHPKSLPKSRNRNPDMQAWTPQNQTQNPEQPGVLIPSFLSQCGPSGTKGSV